MYFYITSSSQDLYHHGVLGQKWGVRRYQNKDGTLTSKGKKHYSESGDSETPKKRGLSEGQKKALKYAAIGIGSAAAVAAVAVGVNYVRKNGVQLQKFKPDDLGMASKGYNNLIKFDELKRRSDIKVSPRETTSFKPKVINNRNPSEAERTKRAVNAVKNLTKMYENAKDPAQKELIQKRIRLLLEESKTPGYWGG